MSQDELRDTLRQLIAVLQAERQALAGLDLLYGGLATPASLRMAEALYPVLRQPAQDGEPGS